MPTYSSKGILAVLETMLREYQHSLRSSSQRRAEWGQDRDDGERLVGAAVFVKRLAASVRDVELIGEAELVKLEAEDILRALNNGKFKRHPEGRATRARDAHHQETYSSEQVLLILHRLFGEDEEDPAHEDIWRLGSDVIRAAAAFVKRLAATEKDVSLVGGAELISLEMEKQERDAEDEFRREGEEREREAEEKKRRYWEENDAVTVAHLGDHLSPPLGSALVNKLLAQIGLQTRTPEKQWVFTPEGLEYTKALGASVGTHVPWCTWSKAVLPLLQAALARADASGTS